MSQQDRADALAPASPRECLRFLKTLPNAPSRLGIALFFGLFSITVIMMNLVSQVLGRVVDIIQGVEVPVLGTGRAAMVSALVIIAVGYLVEVTGRTVGRFLVTSTTRRLSVDLRTSALDSTLGAPVPTVMELGTGNIITRLSKDIDTVVMTISMMGDRLVLTLFMLPLTALMMIFIHPAYALLFIAVSCLLYPFIRGTMRDIPAVANEVSSVEAYRNNVLLDTIRALETLRQFSLKDWALARMARYSWDTVQAWGDKVPLINRILGQGALAFAVLLLGSVLMSVPMVMWEWLTPGEATAAVLLVMRLEVHVFNILFFAGEIQHSVTSLGRAVALATLKSSAGTKELKDTPRLTSAPAITIENLSYSYPGGAPVLDDVSLTLTAGTTPPWWVPPVRVSRPSLPSSRACNTLRREQSASTGLIPPPCQIPGLPSTSRSLPKKCTSSPAPCARTCCWPNLTPAMRSYGRRSTRWAWMSSRGGCLRASIRRLAPETRRSVRRPSSSFLWLA